MKTDEICEYYAKKGTKLTVKMLDEETVLLEGNQESLIFLGKILLAHVEEQGDGRQLSPNGAGQNLFSNESTLGLYIHRIPCNEEKE